MNAIPNTAAAIPLQPAAAGATSAAGRGAGPGNASGKSRAQQEQDAATVRKLKARDRQVRAHEQAHLSAAGGYATSGMNFTYQRGPNGVMYAVGGEVSIDTSPVPGDPQATLRKAQTIIRAALAPAEPSSQDRQVAAEARQMANKARTDLAKAQSGAATAPSSASDGNGQRLQQRIAAAGGSGGDGNGGRLSLFA